MTRLSELTTLHVGGPARTVIFAQSETELIGAVQAADAVHEPLLILGGGSNVLVGDEGFDGTVIVVQTQGNSYEIDACSGGMLQVAAGVNWDEFVAFTLEKKLANLESLSGIPGTVGAAPIQNIGAYGHEVGEVIARVRAYDRVKQEIHTFTASECGFGYRTSIFKEQAERYLVLDVTFQLRRGESSLPVLYSELAQSLGVEVGARVPTQELRAQVLEIRRSKGMLYKPEQSENLWSAGSFFTNPIVSAELAETLPADAPRFGQPDGRVKLSAAWLMQRAGVVKGESNGGAKISERHVLALTNAGSATASDLIELARIARDKVKAHFGIELTPEVRLINTVL
jgi:UDP-N-acetylmuramate dehydrogenase